MPRPRTLDPGASPAACLGALLRRLRTLQGLTQAGLGRLAGYDGSYVGAVERAAARPSRDLVERCDRALRADGVLLALWPLADQDWRALTGPGPDRPAGPSPGPDGPAGPSSDPDGRAGPSPGPDGRARPPRDPPAAPPRDGPAAGPAAGRPGDRADPAWAAPARVPPDRTGAVGSQGGPGAGAGSAAVVEAMEVARLAEASDVGAGTLAELERVVERLCAAGAGTPPELLIPAVEERRRYVVRLLAGRLTLGRRRRLLVAAGWLSLLLAQLHFDAGEREAAEANRDTAHRLAQQAGHAELAARAVGTLAAWALADGRFREAVELARAGQDLAPPAGPAALQLALDEAQAWTSLGDRRQAAAARHQAALTRAMLPGAGPARPATGDPGEAAPGLDLAGAAAS
jgi:Helix-turn-helix domain